ncbi:hypothetical protein BD769DRAFT_1386958 [Suillus cothurnatus]|nr:hypothetical protein BD769DRAFT_1386958 [Suillus cothurnatus]
MPQHHHAHGKDFTQDLENIDSSSITDLTNSDGDKSNNDSDLLQALELAQRLLLDMWEKYQESLKKNALLKATLSKGQKIKLTNKDLALAAKEDIIKNYGHKFSVTHCLWVETTIFPLHTPPPNIVLMSKEWWLSPMSIQNGIKAELFHFILPVDHGMMAYKNFGFHVDLESIAFGRSLLAANAPPTHKTKAKIWELCCVTPGLIAAAAVVVTCYLYSFW